MQGRLALCAFAVIFAAVVRIDAYPQSDQQHEVSWDPVAQQPMIWTKGGMMPDPPPSPYIKNLTAACPATHGIDYVVTIPLAVGFDSTASSPFSWDFLVWRGTMDLGDLSPKYMGGASDYPAFAAPTISRCNANGNCMDAYEINMTVGWKDYGCPTGLTQIIGYNGTFPGPTFYIPAGKPVMVRFNNMMPLSQLLSLQDGGQISAVEPCDDVKLPAANQGRGSTIHLHGGSTVAAYDGWGEDRYCPQFTKDYVFATEMTAFTWYHDHSVDFTTDSVYFGLAGLYIVLTGPGCTSPWNLDKLPPAVWAIGDSTFTSTCQKRFEHTEASLYGDVVSINGVAWPLITMSAQWTHIRFLGASNERFWLMRMVDVYGNDVSSKICKVVASESGIGRVPLNYPPSGLHMVPGERWEIVCNFEGLAGKTLYLWNEYDNERMIYEPLFCYTHLIAKLNFVAAPANPPKFVFNGIYETNIDMVLSQGTINYALNLALAGNCTRTMLFNLIFTPGPYQFSFGINNETWYSNQVGPDDIGVNTWEIWCLKTDPDIAHPIHIHMVHGYILTRNGTVDGLEPYEVYMPKDVWHMYPSIPMVVLVRFGPFQGEWAFHCHNTKHEDLYMMRSLFIKPVKETPYKGKGLDSGFTFIPDEVTYNELSSVDGRPPVPTAGIESLSDALDAKLAENAYRVFYPSNSTTNPTDKLLRDGKKNPWLYRCNKFTTVTSATALKAAAKAIAPYGNVARNCGWSVAHQCKLQLPQIGTVPKPYKYPTA